MIHRFALFLALLLAVAAVPLRAAGWDGVWRVTLAAKGGEIPFGLEVKTSGGKTSAWLLNAPERMRVETASIAGDTLTLEFPSYGSKMELTRGADDRLTGQATLVRRTGPAVIAASGERGSWRFTPKTGTAKADFNGRWQLRHGPNKTPGEASFRQSGSRVSGSVQLPSGDFRYLSGDVIGDTLYLSTFDGNWASLWTARAEKGALVDGKVFALTGGNVATPWTATRAPREKMEAVAVEKAPVKRFDFRFPDSKGRMVALSDPQFRGKVVVVTLGGTWCPNCHDEAIFMGPYAIKHRPEGLEVIALQFEYGTDAARANRLMDNFARRYKLPYPQLLAGEPTPESTKAALPGVGPVKVYPTTLFIGRDGTLREVHVGWAGPATGALNAKAKKDFDATVTKLLREKA
jgi:thiol-disulfide isomerase/thioredoxin